MVDARNAKVKFSHIGREFLDFYRLAWEKNWKLTLALSLFMVIAGYDEVVEFLRGHGTFFEFIQLWVRLAKLLNIIS